MSAQFLPSAEGRPGLFEAARGAVPEAAPLPHADRIQRLFGRHDVGAIQAHEGAPDAAMGAHAFARGHDIHLPGGRNLAEQALPHEAAHVVQQRVGRLL